MDPSLSYVLLLTIRRDILPVLQVIDFTKPAEKIAARKLGGLENDSGGMKCFVVITR
jgi:hypothetical protein